MAPEQTTAEPPGRADGKRPRSPYAYSLGLLTAIYIFNFIDRKFPFILIESIKADLKLSDTQIGLLTGVAFTLIYAIAGVPIAQLAEKYGRRRIIAASVLVWSVLTAAGGLSTNFWQLALARIGVAVGESGSTPASHSLIASYFKRGRATALAVFSMGAPMGVLIGLAAGGAINDLANWRVAMFVLGVPGLILAILALTTITEPPVEVQRESEPSKLHGLRYLLKLPTFRHLAAAGLLFGCASGATATFTPAYLMRSFDLSASHVGLFYGLLVGSVGAAGALLGGYLSDRLRTRDARWGLWLVAGGLALTVPFHVMAFNGPSFALVIALLFVPEFFQMFYAAPTFYAIQTLLPSRMRALGSAAFLFFATGIGISLGPFLAGLFSDHLRPIAGQQSLSLALSIIALLKLWSAFHYYMASRRLRQDTYVEA